MKKNAVITHEQFLVDEERKIAGADGAFSKILRDLAYVSKNVNKLVRNAGLADILGNHGSTNVQGEEVKKLDIICNEAFIEGLERGEDCCAVVSEENDDIHHIEVTNERGGKYIVTMDPLDGSSNIDVNAPIGTIFAIYKKIDEGSKATMADCMQKGNAQLAAGYIIYGSSTMLVYTTGNGVNGFTLDDTINEYCLSHPNMQIPKDGKIYSLNEGNIQHFPKGVQDFVKYCQDNSFSARYIGSMVGDFHRNLLKGGIFIYPPTDKAPNGKLRLLYECNPMSMLIEQAGGRATTGKERILDIQPMELHQRVPIFIGSENLVKKAEEFFNA